MKKLWLIAFFFNLSLLSYTKESFSFVSGEKFSSDYFKFQSYQTNDAWNFGAFVYPERLGKKGYGLEYLSETQLGLKGIEFDEIVQKGQTFEDVPLETAVKYAAEDADFTLQLGLYYTKDEKWFTQNKKLIELLN